MSDIGNQEVLQALHLLDDNISENLKVFSKRLDSLEKISKAEKTEETKRSGKFRRKRKSSSTPSVRSRRTKKKKISAELKQQIINLSGEHVFTLASSKNISTSASKKLWY